MVGMMFNSTVCPICGETHRWPNGRWEKHIYGYLQDFLFTPERARRPARYLSGGERNRLLLARLFKRPSNVMVLDEPTNDLDTETLIWRDFMPVVCSSALFGRDRRSGESLWTYTPSDGVIINPTIAVGGDRVYCVESTNPESRNFADGRVKLCP